MPHQEEQSVKPTVLLHLANFLLDCFTMGYYLLFAVPRTMGLYLNPIPQVIAVGLPLLYSEMCGFGPRTGGHDPGLLLISKWTFWMMVIQRVASLFSNGHSKDTGLTWGEKYGVTPAKGRVLDVFFIGSIIALFALNGYVLAAKYLVGTVVLGQLGVLKIRWRVTRQATLALDGAMEAQQVGEAIKRRL